jgi:hypothetical protein
MGSPSYFRLGSYQAVLWLWVRCQVRKWYDGSGWFVAGAVVLLVFAALVLLVGLQSPDRVLWSGQRVVGAEHQELSITRGTASRIQLMPRRLQQCRPGLSHGLTCRAGYPRVTVRDRSSPGLMAR